MEISACVMRAFVYRGLTSRQIMRMILSFMLLFQGKACGEQQRSGNGGGFACLTLTGIEIDKSGT